MSKPQGKTEIDVVNSKFIENISAKDPAALVRDFYDESAVLMPGGSEKNFKGTKALVAFWKNMIFTEKAEDVILRTEAFGVAGDLVYEIGRFSYTSPNKKGVRSKNTGKSLVIFKRSKSGLKAVVDMFSTNE